MGYNAAPLEKLAEGFLGVGRSAIDRLGFIGADGHRHTGHLRDQLFDELLAFLVGAEKIPEGLSAIESTRVPSK